MIFVQATETNGLNKVHLCWAGVYVLEALAVLLPTIHLVLMDLDTAPAALAEIDQLFNLMQYLSPTPDTTAEVLLSSERYSLINAGMVVIKRTEKRSCVCETQDTRFNADNAAAKTRCES